LKLDVDVTRNSSVVPCVNTPRTSLSPNFTLRIVFIVGTAVISSVPGVSRMMRLRSSA
jgi:hypothetical protein